VIGKESKSHALADTIHNDMLGAKGSAMMDTLFVLGVIVAALLWGLVACFLLGAVVTYLFRIETAGVNLEDFGK